MNHFKLICFCFLLLPFANRGLGQGIPNGSFEETTLDSWGNIAPKGWNHNYITVLMCLTKEQAVDTAYEGNRFVALGNIPGKYDSAVCILSTKFKLTSLPSELTAHYKYFPIATNEKFLAKAILYRRTASGNLIDTVAVGTFEPAVSERSKKWTQLKFKIEYRQEIEPDSAEVIFYTSQKDVYVTQTFLLLDDVKFSDSLRALSIGDKVVFQPANKVSVYPNPVTNQLFVKINEFSNKNYTLKIYDLLGRELINKQFTGENNPEFEINTSLLATGVYVLDVKSEDRSIEVRSKITVAKP